MSVLRLALGVFPQEVKENAAAAIAKIAAKVIFFILIVVIILIDFFAFIALYAGYKTAETMLSAPWNLHI